MGKLRKWTSEDTEAARHLVAIDASNELCLEALGRTRTSCRQRLKYVDDPSVPARMSSRVRNRKSEAVAGNHMAEGSRGAPPAHLVAEAHQRACAARTLTAWVLGDPCPGYSALDQRAKSNAADVERPASACHREARAI
jgi:hypothetical protein